jgi:S1-C subfamily serine protease
MAFPKSLVRTASLLLIVTALPAGRAAAQDLTAQQRQRLYYEVKPAVVLVWASASAQISVSAPATAVAGPSTGITDVLNLELGADLATFGSGFIVSPDGYIATNGHVIQLFHEQNERQLEAELLYAALENSGFFEREAIIRTVGDGVPLSNDRKLLLTARLLPHARFRLDKDLDVYLQNWRRYPAEVKEYSPPIYPFPGRVSLPGITFASGKDVAILKVEGRDFPTMTIGDSNLMAIAANVTAAGYPGGATFFSQLNPTEPMQASFTRGQIASLKVDVRGASLIQIDAAVSGGNSGGPVLSDRGEVIGMTTMGLEQGFNFAVPTGTIMEFVRSAGVTPQTSLFDRIWREALTHYFRGETDASLNETQRRAAYRASINSLDEVLRLMPDLPDAVSLRQEALRRIPLGDEGAGSGTSTGTPWMIGLLLIGGIGLVGAGVWMKNRGGSQDQARVTPLPVSRKGDQGGQSGRLVVTAGPLQGNQFPVTVKGLKIGRDPDSCQVVLTESTVSREHAVLYLSSSENGFVIKNLSGTNSTMVNDRAVQEATLKPGDRIKIGSSILNYEPN